MPDKDNIDVEIDEDGTFKADSGQISGPSHGSAEALLRQIASDLAGDSKRIKISGVKEDKPRLKQ